MNTRPRMMLLAALLPCAACAWGQPHVTLASRDYPRAFFFRASESVGPLAKRGRLTHERWDQAFSRLSGIMGKTLEEEVPGRSANIPHFTQFKRDHPRQVVLLHYNGDSRDPRGGTQDFFAGHWIYHTGCKLTRDLPADAGESVIHVEDPNLFRTEMGRYLDKNEDLAICMLDEQGRPDWHRCEQLELLAKDAKAKTLRVKRGCFGTQPRSFPAGKAYVAAHTSNGPWGRRSHLLWYYNFSTRCPRDAKGRTCVDVLVEDFARRFLPGGALAAYDGVEFDVMHHSFGPPRSGRHGLDMTGDGRPDWGYVDGLNTYGLGVYDFCRRLRAKLGDNRVLQADGASANSQRAFGQLNGIESEGWPILSDWEIRDWSGGLNRHRYWAAFARTPKFNYINHKYTMAGDKPGTRKRPQVPFSTHRLVFAVAQFVDAAITYSSPPPREPNERIGIWDELCMGAEKKLGWLGQPLGPAVSLAKQHPDLLEGQGQRMDAAFAAKWQGKGATVRPDGQSLKVSFKDDARKLTLAGVPADGPDLTVCVKMRAAALEGYPAAAPRLVWVGIAPDQGLLVRREPPEAGMCLRGEAEKALDTSSGAGVRYSPKRKLGEETHAAYLCHPPYRGGVGYTFWAHPAPVPQQGKLTFYTGLSEKAATRSDGVTYRVLLKSGESPYATVFEKHVTEWRWRPHEVDLARWAGQRVTLKFVTDCGPKDNTVTDHSSWGDVQLVSADPAWKVTAPIRHMTFAGSEWSESTFYFRAVQTRTVDLEFAFEGSGPVWLSHLTVHAHPEAMYRRFERGLVLGNPSPRPYTFDLHKTAPGNRYRRIKAQPKQDPATNNGQPAGRMVTLGPKDGLFLSRVP